MSIPEEKKIISKHSCSFIATESAVDPVEPQEPSCITLHTKTTKSDELEAFLPESPSILKNGETKSTALEAFLRESPSSVLRSEMAKLVKPQVAPSCVSEIGIVRSFTATVCYLMYNRTIGGLDILLVVPVKQDLSNIHIKSLKIYVEVNKLFIASDTEYVQYLTKHIVDIKVEPVDSKYKNIVHRFKAYLTDGSYISVGQNFPGSSCTEYCHHVGDGNVPDTGICYDYFDFIHSEYVRRLDKKLNKHVFLK